MMRVGDRVELKRTVADRIGFPQTGIKGTIISVEPMMGVTVEHDNNNGTYNWSFDEVKRLREVVE